MKQNNKTPHSVDSHSENTNKLEEGHIFLTITFDNRDQKGHLLSFKKRIAHINTLYRENIKPHLIKCMTNYQCSLEISEALASKGSYYPRLHYHILGYLENPLYLLLTVGQLVQGRNYGYHIIANLTEKQFNQKLIYINKQTLQWKKLTDILTISEWIYKDIYIKKEE